MAKLTAILQLLSYYMYMYILLNALNLNLKGDDAKKSLIQSLMDIMVEVSSSGKFSVLSIHDPPHNPPQDPPQDPPHDPPHNPLDDPPCESADNATLHNTEQNSSNTQVQSTSGNQGSSGHHGNNETEDSDTVSQNSIEQDVQSEERQAKRPRLDQELFHSRLRYDSQQRNTMWLFNDQICLCTIKLSQADCDDKSN